VFRSPEGCSREAHGWGGSALARVYRALARLVQSWWSIDRVRASPREGRILRLRPPAWILLDGREVEVLRRSVFRGAEGGSVVYDCQTEYGPAQIRVSTVGPLYSTQIYWVQRGQPQLLDEDRLEIWNP
jgi:hypothetical protein